MEIEGQSGLIERDRRVHPAKIVMVRQRAADRIADTRADEQAWIGRAAAVGIVAGRSRVKRVR